MFILKQGSTSCNKHLCKNCYKSMFSSQVEEAKIRKFFERSQTCLGMRASRQTVQPRDKCNTKLVL